MMTRAAAAAQKKRRRRRNGEEEEAIFQGEGEYTLLSPPSKKSNRRTRHQGRESNIDNVVSPRRRSSSSSRVNGQVTTETAGILGETRMSSSEGSLKSSKNTSKKRKRRVSESDGGRSNDKQTKTSKETSTSRSPEIFHTETNTSLQGQNIFGNLMSAASSARTLVHTVSTSISVAFQHAALDCRLHSSSSTEGRNLKGSDEILYLPPLTMNSHPTLETSPSDPEVLEVPDSDDDDDDNDDDTNKVTSKDGKKEDIVEVVQELSFDETLHRKFKEAQSDGRCVDLSDMSPGQKLKTKPKRKGKKKAACRNKRKSTNKV